MVAQSSAVAPAVVDDSDRRSLELSTGFARVSLGLIIPAGSRMIERQFGHFAPTEFGIHATRLQMNGNYHKSLPQLLECVGQAARTLADAQVDLIGFHCTSNSMEYGPEGDQRIRETIIRETGTPAISTGQAVTEALTRLAVKRMVLVTPYRQSANDHERDYLHALGFEVVHDVALGETGELGPTYMISPARWIDVVRANARDTADAYFLSCANTTQIDTILPLERELGKPVVASNQAMLWACLERVTSKLGPLQPIAEFGRLMQQTN
jgi:maleate cis-trans isomerase